MRVVGTALDISRRKAASAALAESQARYRTLFDAIEAGFCVVEVDLAAPDGRIDYRVVEANPAFYRQTGFSEQIFGQWLRKAAPDLEEHWYEIYGRMREERPPASEQRGAPFTKMVSMNCSTCSAALSTMDRAISSSASAKSNTTGAKAA